MKTEWRLDNEGGRYNWTCESEESKEDMEMNENDEMEWNESIGVEMDKSEIDWSGWEEERDGNECIKNMDDNRNE